MRAGEWNLNIAGADHSVVFIRSVHREIFDRSYERGEFADSEHYCRKVGRVRGKEHVDCHHICRDVARHRGIHSYVGTNLTLFGLGGYLLHPRHVTVHLVRRVLYIFRRLAGGSEVHLGARENADRDVVWPPSAHLLKNGRAVEEYIQVEAVSSSDRYQLLGQLLLVLLAHPIAALHEQDIALRHPIGKSVERHIIIIIIIIYCVQILMLAAHLNMKTTLYVCINVKKLVLSSTVT